MPTIITPERLSFLFMFVGFAIFTTTRRNRRTYQVSFITAVLYAFLEILAQGALLGLVLYGFLFLITSFLPGRLGAFLSLILTVLLVLRPTRKITSSIEAYLASEFGTKEGANNSL